jgi:hypothetical protein|tara:strand:- start:679 stop:1296 length:618 start_codon:yes stop_codon:yes gene_type:complete
MTSKKGESTIYLLYKGRDRDELPDLLKDMISARELEVLKQIKKIKVAQSKAVFTYLDGKTEHQLKKEKFKTFFLFNQKKPSIVGFLDKITDKKHILKQGLSIKYEFVYIDRVLLIINILNDFDTNTEFYGQNSFKAIIELFENYKFKKIDKDEANAFLTLAEPSKTKEKRGNKSEKKKSQKEDAPLLSHQRRRGGRAPTTATVEN